jgi:hypothetical protein
MAKTLVDLEGLDSIDGDFEDISALESDLDGQLDDIFSEFGGDESTEDYSLRIYRPQDKKGKLSYMFACTPLDLPILDRLRDEYGGGSFQVRVLKNGKIFRRLSVLVEAPIKKNIESNTDMVSMMGAMNQGFQRLGELLVNQKEIVPPANSMKDMLESMVLMKEVMGSPIAPPDPIKLLKDVLGIQKTLTGGQNDKETNVNDVFLGLVENVLPRLADVGLTENNVTSNVNETSTDDTTEGSVNTVKVSPMKMHLVFLCAQAAKNRNPVIYAQMVLDNTPDNKLDELIDFMEMDNAFDEMVIIHKGVSRYPEWFRNLKEAILSEIEVIEEKVINESLTDKELSPKTDDNVSNNSGEKKTG